MQFAHRFPCNFRNYEIFRRTPLEAVDSLYYVEAEPINFTQLDGRNYRSDHPEVMLC